MNRSRPSTPIPDSDRRLSSWKQIARYLDRGVRTVQRWHSGLGLPVHSVNTRTRSRVFAYKAELDQWLQQCAERDHVDGQPFGQNPINNPRVLRAHSAVRKLASMASQQYDHVASIRDNVLRMVERQTERRKALMKSRDYPGDVRRFRLDN